MRNYDQVPRARPVIEELPAGLDTMRTERAPREIGLRSGSRPIGCRHNMLRPRRGNGRWTYACPPIGFQAFAGMRLLLAVLLCALLTPARAAAVDWSKAQLVSLT